MKREIEINSEYSESVNFSFEKVKQFAELSGDKNPIHVDGEYAATTQFKKCIVHGLLASSVFTKMMADKFPGPGTVHLGQTLDFKKPIYPDENYRAVLKVIGKRTTSKDQLIYKISTQLLDKNNSVLIDGVATVLL